jgi:plastocyanin
MRLTSHGPIAASLAALCLLALAGCAGGGGGAQPTMDVTITATDTFSPVTLYAPAGEVVRWTNTDTDPHTVTADPGNASPLGPNSDLRLSTGIPAGQTYSWMIPHQAPKGSVYTYHCRFHGTAGNGTEVGTGMAGRIIVH